LKDFLNGTTGAATFAGTITAPSYAIYGGLERNFVMVHQIQHLTQHLQVLLVQLVLLQDLNLVVG
jgi:hypothetical protein